ncbi:hypothetical protein D3C85_1217560 [compost metagenome]
MFNLKDKARAEQNFVEALQVELKKELAVKKSTPPESESLTDEGEVLGNNDPALVRAIYRDALKSVSVASQAEGIVFKALNDLAEKDKKYIKATLNVNSIAGRGRYLSKVFRKALAIMH